MYLSVASGPGLYRSGLYRTGLVVLGSVQNRSLYIVVFYLCISGPDGKPQVHFRMDPSFLTREGLYRFKSVPESAPQK